MQKAGRAPTLAAASNHSAFNLANAGGAWLGGAGISAGLGYASPAVIGAVLAVVGLAVAVLSGRLDRGRNTAGPRSVVSNTAAAGEDETVPACDVR
ncbi:hypothetical protein GCM10027174_07880 [Salinifilum aidingensis]